MSLLKARGLVKSYGRRRVVDGVDFEVDQGEIVGLLGPNGAGKTTTFRMVCGMIDPDAGRVTLAGQDVTNWPMFRRAKDGGMGYLAQESSVFRKLSVQKNLLGVMEMLGMNRKVRTRRAEQLMEQFSGNVVHTIASYNAGPLAVGNWIAQYRTQGPDEFVELIPYQETRQYVKRVLRSYREYVRLGSIS